MKTSEELAWQVEALHAAIAETPPEVQEKVKACYYELRHWLTQHAEPGILAFSLVGAELGQQADQEQW